MNSSIFRISHRRPPLGAYCGKKSWALVSGEGELSSQALCVLSVKREIFLFYLGGDESLVGDGEVVALVLSCSEKWITHDQVSLELPR